MTDISNLRNKLREFSDYKIRDGQSAITIYKGGRDIAIIYKLSGDTQIDRHLYLEIPEPDRAKFNEVVLELKQIAKAQNTKRIEEETNEK